MESLLQEHLSHIRHLEEERALLLGFYGAIASIIMVEALRYGNGLLYASSLLMLLLAIISIFFLLIVIKIDMEFIKHWRAVRILSIKLMCETCRRIYKPDLNKYVEAFGLTALFPIRRSRLSTHKLIESLMVLVIVFSALSIAIRGWETLIALCIALVASVIYYLIISNIIYSRFEPEHLIGVRFSRRGKIYAGLGIHGDEVPIDDEDLVTFKDTAKELCEKLSRLCAN